MVDQLVPWVRTGGGGSLIIVKKTKIVQEQRWCALGG